MKLYSRKLIDNEEKGFTFFQLIGVILVAVGIVMIFTSIFFIGKEKEISSNLISIGFFITMLGFSFAFPSLLEGNEGLSTMRIVVFMMINVICMLMLKVGWSSEIKNLADLKVDPYWMGIIAFVFGAKATQAYFENAKSFFPNASTSDASDSPISKSAISRLAANQNRDELLAKHPNIECVSDTLKNGNSTVTIYVKDNQIETIPKELSATLKNGSVVKVPTEIISDSGEGTPHIGQATDELSDSNSRNYFGSICCMVDSTTNPNFKGIVTAGHVFTYGDYFDYGGVLGENQRRDALLNGNPKAKLFFQQMKFNQDIAITELIDKANLNANYISFAKGYYQVSEFDFNSNTQNVTIASRQNNIRDAYILDFNVSFEIKYFNSPRYVRNIILIGSTNDRATSQTVSEGGDSGSCVYHKETGRLIGLLLGGNKKFSFVLPIQETLNSFNFILS